VATGRNKDHKKRKKNVKGNGKEWRKETNSEGILCYVVCKTYESIFVFVVAGGDSVFV